MTYAALLLCAGYGTRMGALTAETPKPLLDIAGRALLDPLLDQLDGLPGLGSIHIVTNRRHAPAFSAWADERKGSLRAELILHDDGSTSNGDRLGAIGDLEFVLGRLPEIPDGALVAAGDNILRFGLDRFWRRFRDTGHTRILALEEKDKARLRRTGVLRLDGDRVVELLEKPEEPPSQWASPACYCLDRAALAGVGAYLGNGGPRDEIGRYIAHLVDRHDVRAFRLRGERLHVGHPQELDRAREILAKEPVITSTGEELHRGTD
ncbi:MAG: sugar phosphate nucleotidyltransferase [Acidobacteriota bacterium]